jgi:quercetin dioxygenase-like cupin family protein
MRDLVAYQDGAVVSRTIVDTGAGTVTAFAFDEGQGLSEHTASYDAMVIVIEGKVDVRISGSVFRLKAGQIITMPANKSHALRAITRFKMLLVMIRAKRSADKK